MPDVFINRSTHNDRLVPRLTGCARCGETHTGLTFKELIRVTDLYDADGDGPYTHWCLCPRTHEPIMMVIRNVQPQQSISADAGGSGEGKTTEG